MNFNSSTCCSHAVFANCVFTDGFNLLNERSLTFGIELEDQQQRKDLLMMTPFYWSARQDNIEVMLASMVHVSADFTIRVWQKN